MLDSISQNWRRSPEVEALDAAMGGADTSVMSGIIAGTRIATARGWQHVEDVKPGDAVLTFDNGLRPVRSVQRLPLWAGAGSCPRQILPLHVPAGVLGNREPMQVLPFQGLMVESDAAEAATGDPFALIRAEALEGVCGIRRTEEAARVEVFVLQFDEDEIVFTAHGALCICGAAGNLLTRAFGQASGGLDYRLLSGETDADLIADIRCEVIEAFLDGDMPMDDEDFIDLAQVA